jgi:anti-sigma-K factor RskA
VQHCTPEQLSLAALREPLPDADAAHLDTCARCREELASLRRGVDALAVPELAAPGAAVPPPPRVWAAIAAATGVTAAPRPEATAAAAPAAPAAVPPPPPAAVPPPAAPTPEPAAVVPLRTRRSRLLLAAAASLVVGVGIGAGAVALGTGDDEGLAVAAAALDPLEGSGASGEARVVERADGTLVLEVDLTAADPERGFYEVWLLDEAVEDLVSLGIVRGGSEVALTLPSGVDLGEYPIVDVSVEPLDGEPGHSGVSVARGTLA